MAFSPINAQSSEIISVFILANGDSEQLIMGESVMTTNHQIFTDCSCVSFGLLSSVPKLILC